MILSREGWQHLRLKTAERICSDLENLEGDRREQAECMMWLHLLYWADPDLEFNSDELEAGEAEHGKRILAMERCTFS